MANPDTGVKLSLSNVPNSTAATVETGYLSAFAPVELPASQDRIDNMEDKLSAPVGEASDAYEKLNTFYTANQSAIDSAGSALASDLNVKSLENAITTFAETSKVLMKGLDVLGQLHPFVGVAVLAFKLVITLDITRRDNNKKVLAVKIQMQDMMTVLFQLRDMHDPEVKGPDGKTLKDRMSVLMSSIADDITACGSACDLYMKKSFLAKTFKSKIYEGRLADYVTMFDKHKKAVGFQLKVHTALGVGAANIKLDGQGEQLKSMSEKMDAIFRMLDTQRDRDVQKFINKKGGARACVDNEVMLQELVSISKESLSSLDSTHSGTGDLASVRRLLNKELSEDVDEAFKKNMELFVGKLEIQHKQLTDAISSTEQHIIGFLSGGAHDKISDPELQAIWREQHWKGSVKARHFVLALHDYYMGNFSNIPAADVAGGPVPVVPLTPVGRPPGAKPEDDRWALAYINVARLQPILEAVDDDGTGFVSIKEANDFAMSRPEGCSLLGWMAFWAAGWHTTVTWYKNRIYNILYAMMRLLQRMKPANVRAADTYFAGPAIQRVELLLRSTRSAPSTIHNDVRLARITDAFKELEEKKLVTHLDRLRYELDDPATLRMITDSRRIERYVYPLLYLLLKRHFDIMRLACIHVLYTDEFEFMSGSLATVFKAVDERTNNLEAVFRSTSGNVKERLGQIAFGMFQLQMAYSEYQLDPINNTIEAFDEEDGFKYDDEDLGPDSDDDEETEKSIFARINLGKEKWKKWLRYWPNDEPVNIYNFKATHPPPATLIDPLDGLWTGQLREVHKGKKETSEGTMSMVLTRAGDKLSGAVENFSDILDLEGTVEQHKINFTIDWKDYAVACTGQYDSKTDTITGFWKEKEVDDSSSEDSNSDDDTDSSDDSGDSGSSDDSGESSSNSASGSESESETEEGNNGVDHNEDGADSEDSTQTFIFRRTPADVYRFRYTDAQFAENPARARWGFAIAATIDQVQRTRLSWPYLKKRFAERKRYIELAKRETMADRNVTPRTSLDDNEAAELVRLKDDLHPSDARFYDLVVDFELEQIVYYDRVCDSCKRDVQDVLLSCIQCMDVRYDDAIDLCSECFDETPERDGFVHVRSHLLIKTLRRIHGGDKAWIIPEARLVAKRAKKAFQDISSLLTRIEGMRPDRHSKKTRSHPAKCCCCGKPVSCPCWVCVDCGKVHMSVWTVTTSVLSPTRSTNQRTTSTTRLSTSTTRNPSRSHYPRM
ncbi:hypothetical protein B0H19DRAFT_482579 [Mycena capillaripes]|nr:hypothetical protein B0H19DRAFT_482579 [Mycena capillaripes]